MSVVKRIPAEDQTVVVVNEDDYVALLLFYCAMHPENLDHPEQVVLLTLAEAEQLAAALVEAAARMGAAA